MKNGTVAMWFDPRGGILALILGGLAAACAQTTTGTGSGETHFLVECSETCTAELQCLRGACTRPCADDLDCSDLSPIATCETSDDGVIPRCEQRCERDHDCAAVGSRHRCAAGVCRAPRPPENGSGSDPKASGGQAVRLACEGGCGDTACAFTGTGCELASACGAVACGGVNFDANACLRSECASDEDCSPEERCTPMAMAGSACERGADRCTCPAKTPWPLATCSPVDVAGPRGAWRSVTLTHRNELRERWLRYRPDGSADARDFGDIRTAPVLSGNDAARARFNELMDGRIRAVLSAPEGCSVPDREVELSVDLETITLTRIVTDCEGEPELAELLGLLTPR